jgi:hypothetical protein
MNSLIEQQAALARVRKIKIPKQTADDGPVRPGSTRQERFKYQRVEVSIRDGVLLDPKRPVLSAWLGTVYDGLYRMEFVTTNEGEKIDFGDGPGVSIDDGGPFRVRVLASFWDGAGKRRDIGEVIDVPATKYCLIRSAELAGVSGGGIKPRYEPVPSGLVPLRGPVLPANFPSNMSKARRMAAVGLKKQEHELSFAEIVKWFEKRKNGTETFG